MPSKGKRKTLNPKLGSCSDVSGYLWLAGNEGTDKKMKTTIILYAGTTIWVNSFIASKPKISLGFRALTSGLRNWALNSKPLNPEQVLGLLALDLLTVGF